MYHFSSSSHCRAPSSIPTGPDLRTHTLPYPCVATARGSRPRPLRGHRFCRRPTIPLFTFFPGPRLRSDRQQLLHGADVPDRRVSAEEAPAPPARLEVRSGIRGLRASLLRGDGFWRRTAFALALLAIVPVGKCRQWRSPGLPFTFRIKTECTRCVRKVMRMISYASSVKCNRLPRTGRVPYSCKLRSSVKWRQAMRDLEATVFLGVVAEDREATLADPPWLAPRVMHLQACNFDMLNECASTTLLTLPSRCTYVVRHQTRSASGLYCRR